MINFKRTREPRVLRNHDILAARGPKVPVDPRRPYAFFVEPECTATGIVEDVATIFLTNRECPYRCVMCDLWKHTTDERVPDGAIPEQIDFALAQMPATQHIKLYNSGNFFDHQAIPRGDYPAIAQRAGKFRTVIVENHPKLCSDECLRFRDSIPGAFEIAMGLETVHPQALEQLNKQMTLDDFSRATQFLRRNEIHVRAFVLLRPPFLSEEEGLEWALRSIEFAFEVGVECCCVIPTRGGNGIMEHLRASNQFSPPQLSTLESVHAAGLALRRGRVLVDLWDIEKLFPCQHCGPARADRLRQMNLTQRVWPRVGCATCGAVGGGEGETGRPGEETG